MSVLRVEKLFRSLSPKEREAFKARLQTAHISLQKLYNALEELQASRLSLEKAKRQVFKQLYNQTYSKEEDARFRDDCRKLSERIKCFLAEQQCTNALATNPLFEQRFLLEALLERGLWTEFEADYRKACADALATCDYENLIAIELLHVRELWESRTHKPEALKEILAAVKESERYLKAQYAVSHAYLGTFYVTATHYLEVYEKAEHWHPLQSVDFSDSRPPLAEYYECKAKTFVKTQEANLEMAKKALDAIMHLPSLPQKICLEQQAALANMGLAYMLNQDYENAHRYYQRAFEFSEQHRLEFGAPIAFNYASVLMKLGNHRNAAQLFQAKWEDFSKSDIVRQRAEVMRCFCHLFLGEVEQAEALLPKSLVRYPEAIQSYFRYAEVAICFEKRKFLEAQRIAENILKRCQRHASEAFLQNEKRLIEFYRKFVCLVQELEHIPKKRVQLSRLKQKFEAFVSEQPYRQDMLPAVWLKQKLRDYSGSN
ncbi:MAG: tetratricopeptide repeat protein [Candidatus Thermochlorobacter sp.]